MIDASDGRGCFRGSGIPGKYSNIFKIKWTCLPVVGA